MRIRLFLSALLALALCYPAQAQKTKSVLGAEITSQFPSNSTGAITPQVLRNVNNDFLASWQQFPAYNAQTGITYTFQASDYGGLVTFNNVAATAATLPTPTGSFGIGYNVYVRNIGAGTVTVTPSGALINGSATLAITSGQSIWIVSDSANYQVWNNSSGTVTSFNMTVPQSIFSISGVPCTTTCAVSMTTAGTSGAMPFFSSATTLSSSSALTANGLVYGGGAATAPSSTAAGATGTVARGGTPPAFTATPTLGTVSSVGGSIAFANGSSGTVTLSPSTGALGSSILTLPVATDTLVGKATSDALTNKSYNGLSVTTTTGTLSVTSGAILGVVKSLSLTGVDGKVFTLDTNVELSGSNGTRQILPLSASSLASLDLTNQTLTGGALVTATSLSTGSLQVNCGYSPLQYITNGGAFTVTAPANDGSCILLVTNNGSAGSISFSGFSVGSNTGDSLSTTNGSKFSLHIWRVNGTSGYRVAAHQ